MPRNERIYSNQLQIKHILNHIVPIGVPHKLLRVARNGGNQFFHLLRTSLVNALLHDAAPVLVLRNLLALVDHGVEDELKVGGLPRCQDLLDDVVSVYVRRQVLHEVFQIFDDQVDVFLKLYYFDYLLNASSPVGIPAEPNWILLDRVNNFFELVIRTAL